eukprot:TRINITY_DN30931_c0_g1_i1.p1 TRINITY_DN30931_c0_g1~~TRINITY_DN30931_c0_g1_i1.p1  ORF type:complete len:624 (+),score=143.74 TRINITY_DN30931_c0_g1_i1:53-1873(+)
MEPPGNPLVPPVSKKVEAERFEIRIVRQAEGELLGVGYLGVTLTNVMAGKLGDRCGMKKGMHINTINGQKVSSAEHIREAFGEAPLEFAVSGVFPGYTQQSVSPASTHTLGTTRQRLGSYTHVDYSPPFNPTLATLPLVFCSFWVVATLVQHLAWNGATASSPLPALGHLFRLLAIAAYAAHIFKLRDTLILPGQPDRFFIGTCSGSFIVFGLCLSYAAIADWVKCGQDHTPSKYLDVFDANDDCPPFALSCCAALMGLCTVFTSLYCAWLCFSWFRRSPATEHDLLESPVSLLPPPTLLATQMSTLCHSSAVSEADHLLPEQTSAVFPEEREGVTDVVIEDLEMEARVSSRRTTKQGAEILEKVKEYEKQHELKEEQQEEQHKQEEMQREQQERRETEIVIMDIDAISERTQSVGSAASAAPAVVSQRASTVAPGPASVSQPASFSSALSDNDLWEMFLDRLKANHLSLEDVGETRLFGKITSELNFNTVEAVRLEKIMKRKGAAQSITTPVLIPLSRPPPPRTLSSVRRESRQQGAQSMLEAIPNANSTVVRGFSTNQLEGMQRLVAQDYARIRMNEPASVSDVLRGMEARKKLLSYHSATSYS